MIRPARAADAPAIAAIWNPIIRDSVITFNPVEKTDAEIVALIDAGNAQGWAFLVAEDHTGAVLGFARYFQFRSGDGYARSMEHSINLARASRGHGLGHALMDALETHARSRGMRMLIGAVTGSNTASVRFHAMRGYAEVGRIPDAGHKFGHYHELVLMQKRL